MLKAQVGFIGQGFIGKHMADDFENRGYNVIRYSVEESYIANRAKIAECDITFIAVPTPTTPKGTDFSIIRSVLPLVGKGKVAVIKSTILPGTTELLQHEFAEIHVMHSPEFLREKHAAEDTANPERNIVGISVDNEVNRQLANKVMEVLPNSQHSVVTTARNAECIKYIGNAFLYTKLVFMNIMHDFVQSAGADWETVRKSVGDDSRIGHGHTQIIDQSSPNTKAGRGAGGHCFIKDFEALLQYYTKTTPDKSGLSVLEALRNKNNQLLTSTNKDLELLNGVYGENIPI